LIEEGHLHPHFIRDHTEGFEAYRKEYSPETVTEAAAVSAFPRRTSARPPTISGPPGLPEPLDHGIEPEFIGVNKVLSLIDLHLLTGKIERPGVGTFFADGTAQRHGRKGGRRAANLLPAHRDLGQPGAPAHRTSSIGAPARCLQSRGSPRRNNLKALADGRMKAIWIMGTNPLVSLPDVRLAEAALKKARFVVVQADQPRSRRRWPTQT